MLKEAIAFKILSAVVGAAFPAFRPRVIEGGRLRALQDQALIAAPMIDSVVTAAPPSVSQSDAVAAFMSDMMEHACGEGLAFHRVKHSYLQMASNRGWPPISDKALSQRMVDLGCSRRKVDMRSKGGGRRSEIVFPVTMGRSA